MFIDADEADAYCDYNAGGDGVDGNVGNIYGVGRAMFLFAVCGVAGVE